MNSQSPSGGDRSRPVTSSWEAPDGQLPLFLVERRLRAISERGLAMLQAALVETSRRFAARGEPVHYLGSIFVPRQGRLLSLFAGGSIELVQTANEASLAPFISIESAVDLPIRAN